MTANPNKLQSAAADMEKTEVQAMNELQDAGVISDNCVTFADIATADVDKAVDFILFGNETGKLM